MPNHIHNRVTILGDSEQIEACKKSLEFHYDEDGEWGAIDFNKIIPMPKKLRTVKCFSACAHAAMHAMTGKGFWMTDTPHCLPINFNAEMYRAYFKMLNNIRRYGYPTWHEWSVDKWGTKWGAYDCTAKYQSGVSNQIQFDTAWSPPRPIIKKLSEMWSDLTFQVMWSCEFADHAGEFSYRNGEWLTDENYPHLHEKTIEICRALRPDEVDHYKKVDGKWVYVGG